MPRALAIPSDLPEISTRLNRDDVALHYGVSTMTVSRWRKKLGIKPMRRRDVRRAPDNFAVIASGLSYRQAQERWKISRGRAVAWYLEAGLRPRRVRSDAAPPPKGFAEFVAGKAIGPLAAHYGKHHMVIRRWLRVCGITPPAYDQRGVKRPRQSKPFVRSVPERKPAPKGRTVLPAAARQAALPSGREEEAAQHLRRTYPSVFHCNETGRADLKGKFWRCGNAVLTPEEMIERAVRHGWDPDAWMRIAA